jgi:hypothetical protein
MNRPSPHFEREQHDAQVGGAAFFEWQQWWQVFGFDVFHGE